MLELNLWFSPKTGNVYGNLNINQKEEIQNIDKLLSIQEFCELAIKKKFMTMEQLSEFINNPNTDQNATYAFTKGNSIICWNSKKDFAIVIRNQQEMKLTLGVKRRDYKGMPDVYFRG